MFSFDCSVFVPCYDGTDGVTPPVNPPAPPANPPAPPAPPANPPAPPANPPKMFTQDEVNTFLRKEQKTLKQIAEQHERNLKEAVAQQGITEQKRAELQSQLDEVQAKLYTTEQLHTQQLAQAKAAADAKLKQLEGTAKDWETRFTSSTISRDLQDAAVKGDAFNPAQLVAFMRPDTKLVPMTDPTTGQPTGQYQTMVEVPKDGKKELMTPANAVAWMKSLPGQFGNLFKNNAASGTGGNAAPATAPTQSGPIDWNDLSQAQYEALRKDSARSQQLFGRK